MHRIIYLSSAIKILSDEEIKDLLITSRKNNLRDNITGLLLYSDGNFMQILEGEKTEILNLYHKILVDTRHKNIIEINNEPISKRNFSEWTMGFSIVDPEFLKNNNEINIFQLKKPLKNETIINSFIGTFLNTFRNKILYQ